MILPSQALSAPSAIETGKQLPIISACEHFAGTEILIQKSLKHRESSGQNYDLTCDCEDGAELGRESEQIEMILSLLGNLPLGNLPQRHGRVGIRVHPADSSFFREEVSKFINVLGDKLSYLTVPKIRDLEQARAVQELIKTKSNERKLDRSIGIHFLIETQSALRDCWGIASLPNVESLDFGLMDFIADHGGAIDFSCAKSPGQFSHALIHRAKTEITAACLANGIIASHNVSLALKEPEQVYKDALFARQNYGFLRMWSIHPSQIEPIIRAMIPSISEISKIEEVLLRAQSINWAPLSSEGQLHDRASYRSYWQILQRARASGMKISAEAATKLFGE